MMNTYIPVPFTQIKYSGFFSELFEVFKE